MGRSVNSPVEYDIIVHFNWLSNAWTKACLPERNQVPEYCPSHRTMVAKCALKAFSPSQPTVAFHVICHFMLFASCLICTYVILFPYVMQHWTEIGLEAFSFLSNPQFSNRYMLKVSKIDARRNCDVFRVNNNWIPGSAGWSYEFSSVRPSGCPSPFSQNGYIILFLIFWMKLGFTNH